MLGLRGDPGPGVPAAGPAQARPKAARRPASESSAAAASAVAAASWGGTSNPVPPWTTLSVRPPTEAATTGIPQAIASSGVIPNGSYHGVHRTRSADLIRAGTSGRGTAPVKITRLVTP